MILQKEFHVIYALANVCGQDRTLLASLLLRIFRHEKAEAPLLRTLNDREINMEGKKHTQQKTSNNKKQAENMWKGELLDCTLSSSHLDFISSPGLCNRVARNVLIMLFLSHFTIKLHSI